MNYDWAEFEGDRIAFNNIGDEAKGRITALRTEVGQNGKKLPVVTLRDADGNERELWAGTTDLKSQLALIAPQVGWLLKVKFVGEKHTGQPQPMKLFEVVVREPGPRDTVDAMTPGPEQARAALNREPEENLPPAFEDTYSDDPF